MISSDVNYIDFRYLNGACTIKVRFFGQEIAVGENTLHLVIICELLWQLLISPCASIIRFCNQESFKTRMHEIALDSNGKRLLVTSALVRAPIYQVSITIWLHHLDLFSRNRFQWFICIPSGTRPWKWIEDTTAQFIYHKCGLASNTANVHHWVCRPLCPGHIYFMIYSINKVLATILSQLACIDPYWQSYPCVRLGVMILCRMEDELCFCFVTALYV
jgi:hypothetical protein